MIYKNKDINVNIKSEKVDIGNVQASFYTEDKGTGSIRIFINYKGENFDLTQTNFKPKLDLFLQDGSIFIDEPVDIITPTNGLIQYKIRDEVIKHVGVVNAKLFLANGKESIHVVNFSFAILDSGISEKIQKEISVNLVEDTVRKIMSENAMNLLDSEYKEKLELNLKSYLDDNTDKFKGPQGEIGKTGAEGPQGEKGENAKPLTVNSYTYDNAGNTIINMSDGTAFTINKGDKGERGLTGDKGSQGPQGIQGPKGDTGSIPNTDSWQKYKITNDNGTNFYDAALKIDFNDSEQLKALPIGTRYIITSINTPNGTTSSNGWLTKYSRNEIQYLEFRPYNSSQVYIKRYYNSWSVWEEMPSATLLNQLKTTVEMQSALLTSLQQQIDALKGGNA